jgi:hypothetical protein
MYLTGNYKTNYMGLTLKLIILSMQFNPWRKKNKKIIPTYRLFLP